jgi:hypothetical protein
VTLDELDVEIHFVKGMRLFPQFRVFGEVDSRF